MAKEDLDKLKEIFPEACPKFLEEKNLNHVGDMDSLIENILEENYPKKETPLKRNRLSFEDQFDIFLNVLPNADPDFLLTKCNELYETPDQIKHFFNECLESHNYPTREDYKRKTVLCSQQKQYTDNFSVENFLKTIPDPETYFIEKEKNSKHFLKLDKKSELYVIQFIQSRMLNVSQTDILKHLKKSKTFIQAYRNLEKLGILSNSADKIEIPDVIDNIPLLQEIAYINHYQEINDFVTVRKGVELVIKQKAKNDGILLTCLCCYDDEVMPTDIYECNNYCKFCKDCITKSVEIAFTRRNLQFNCLNDCSAIFSLKTLQEALPSRLFFKITTQMQAKEIENAQIENLMFCPHCCFAAIPAEEDKIFKCFNPECMKETCLLCKEPVHIPFKCNEMEKDEEVKARTYIEDKMTEALIRKCWKCGLNFVKLDGCNKMKCSCGALMCYVCRRPVKDYYHFRGEGSNNYHLCPLWSNNNTIHFQAVQNAAEQAKNALRTNDGKEVQLKHDPSNDLDKFYK